MVNRFQKIWQNFTYFLVVAVVVVVVVNHVLMQMTMAVRYDIVLLLNIDLLKMMEEVPAYDLSLCHLKMSSLISILHVSLRKR